MEIGPFRDMRVIKQLLKVLLFSIIFHPVIQNWDKSQIVRMYRQAKVFRHFVVSYLYKLLFAFLNDKPFQKSGQLRGRWGGG